MSKELVIALAGNPNCGKTSLFNELTGSKQHVGNWAGVTVEKKEGKLKFEGRTVRVVDLPGTYSLGAYSEDEVVARDFILKESPDVVINVVDATNIDRNLYLTMQLLETGAKVVLALNMMDEIENKGIKINVPKLESALGISVIPTVATKGKGINELIAEVVKVGDSPNKKDYKIDYGSEIEDGIKQIEKAMEECGVTLEYPLDWTAIKLLENDEYIKGYIEARENGKKIDAEIQKSVEEITASVGYDVDAYIIDKRYENIDKIVKQSIQKAQIQNIETASDKIDKVITNRWLGIPIFAIIMFLMYQISITFGNGFLGGFVDTAFGALGTLVGDGLTNIGAPDLLNSFIVDGLIGGIGSVLVFLPLIFTMYFLIAILEDSGYMARAAYVMDKLMSSLGLHGKTAVSLVIGSGCNVAGIMSTRTLESRKDRMIAILINPFVSCPARLTVYGVFVAAFFANTKLGIVSAGGFIIFLLYVLGIVVAVLAGKFFSDKVFKGENSYFVMELPPYRIPTPKGVLIHMWEKSSVFLKKMGTVILGVVIIVWILSNLPAGVEPGTKDSVLGMIGSVIAPIFKPAGFGDWQSGVALITGFAAKEAVVGTLGTVYGVGDEGVHLINAIHNTFTPLSALSFMIMTLLYVPCVATIGAVKKETNSTKWAVAVVIYTCIIGWVFATVFYQVGYLLGFR
ncbi:ferrous iron transport protein B [Clostridium sp.]|jgi:ferrous iron transport protein B|uniref:ferrous iron transport protein B n=1 Tax=Clostridium sp. TaxID=1506 RepID=UPI0025842309|nr:ferrous iron transport protein B [Clostridium sp.]MDF2503746.1 feoB [Clostridium sp.]